MTRIPQRISLVAQTAAILREEIQAGAYANCLPSEQVLGGSLQVSRVTLRLALAQLEREGLLRAGQGRRRTILAPRRNPAPPPANPVVVLLTPVPLEAMQRFALYWIDDLREHLGEAGYRLELQESRLCYHAQPDRALQGLAQRLNPAGWVLYQSTAPMQRWFSRQALPCVITGSRHPGVQLPSVDLDYRAACRHAAGLFLARGHRRLAFLNPSPGLAGDKESEEGFLEIIRSVPGGGAEAIIAGHDGTIPSLCRRLDALLGHRERPTALLVSKPHHVLTAVGYLAQRGLRLPQDASLISRDHDSFLEHVLPSVARYVASPSAMAHRLSRSVLEMVAGGAIQPASHRILPEFAAGQTLGPAPSRTR
jgi:DNA-binding LacI/PurR family transcriptional regulator